MEHSGVTPHVLRHTFASHAAMRGVPLRQLQVWMGHADLTQTMRYAQLSPQGQDELVNRLAPPRPTSLRVLPGANPEGHHRGTKCPSKRKTSASLG